MKIFSVFVISFCLIFLIFPLVTLAAPTPTTPSVSGGTPEPSKVGLKKGLAEAAGVAGFTDDGGADPGIAVAQLVGRYVGIGFKFVGVIFLIMIVYGGLTWMLAAGKPENVSKARDIMVQAAIGLGVTLLAYQVAGFAIRKISTAADEGAIPTATAPAETTPETPPVVEP
ncbi:hypothetical protein HQ571_01925 [Candidatus Kuenenbacteria bacterium]|nr:hypothetical protein [Candidatus Kuenenbacteria bacterium]